MTVLVILIGCSSPEQPEDLLDKEKMVEVMIEVHLLEAKMAQITIRPQDSSQRVFDHFEKLLFDSLEITQEQYENSFNYYVDQPIEFERIYNAVVDSLMQRDNIGK